MTEEAQEKSVQKDPVRLTPEALLHGREYREDVELRIGDETYLVEVRPLNYTEAARVKRIIAGGVEVKIVKNEKGEDEELVVVVPDKMAAARAEAALVAAELGTGPEFTREVIEGWPPSWVETVGESVMLLSGIGDDAKLVNRFRPQS